MDIQELQKVLQEKRDRGVTQVRITTVLDALAKASEAPKPKARRAARDAVATPQAVEAALLRDAHWNPVTYDNGVVSADDRGVLVQGRLVGTAEAAAILGVERPRIGKWRALNRMPDVASDLAAGPVWLRSQIESMVEATQARRRSTRTP